MFFGTPEWAVPSLDALLRSDVDVAAVVTNPDRPAGRGMKLTPSPVKHRALSAGLDVMQPARARDPELVTALEDIAPDVAVVVAYGKILPKTLLEVPRLGFVNLHFSLLPAYRGAAPVQRALMDGVEETGVSVIVLTEGMDEGPVLATRKVPVSVDDTGGSLGERLAVVGADLLVDALARYGRGELLPEPQDHSRATYAPKITEEDARVSWDKGADEIRNLVRALDPSPGAWTTFRGRRLKIYRLRPSGEGVLAPAEVEGTRGLVVGTGEGSVEIVDAQIAGKRRMSGEEVARGLRVRPGERFE